MKFINVLLTLSLLLSLNATAKEIKINFHGTPIEDVIKFIAKKKKLNILVNERISGNVNFLSNKPIDEKELIPLLEHILMIKGYALSPSSEGYIEIVRAARASKEVSFNEKNTVGMDMVVLRPNYIKPSVVASKIKHLSSQYSLITYDDKMDLLLVSDYPRNIKNMKKLLKLFDTHLKRDLKRVEFTYYNVKTALPKLQSIFDTTKDDYNGEIKLISDDYQNAIWISANSDDMNKAVNFINSFDQQAKDIAKLQTKILFLKNANVEDIVKTAQEIAKSKDTNRPVKSVVTGNKELNALIISSTVNQIKELTKLIEQIDIQRKQVFIKVKIYEISQNSLDELGIKWGAAAGMAENQMIGTSTINMGGSSFVLPSLLTDNLELDKVDAGVALGATIDFLKGAGAVNVVSEPNMLSVNNLKSSLYVGKTQSIKTSDATGSSTTDTTRNTFSREDIGLTLEVTPQITDKDSVVLKIMINVEDVDQTSGAILDQPTTTKRKIDTVAIVEDESSIIIGGLIRDNYSKTEAKVPLLGDVPFLGGLFRHTTESYDKISTIMVLTPYIVTSSKDLAVLQTKLNDINEIKKNMTEKMKNALGKINKEKDDIIDASI
ncbi:MAG: secretin N-terminal domain-containing protein [Campylobacterota bacterium]|nr:secretin N-terminal domain-containing protein [Campylobacterota bacterium]